MANSDVQDIEWLSQITSPLGSQPWKPHDYQMLSIKHLLDRGSAGLFLRPGLGKTSVTLAALKVLKMKKMMHAALVLSPLRPAKMVWPKEVQKWTDFNGFKVVVLHGDEKDALLDEPADIYILNYEGLQWFTTVNGIARTGVDILIADESTKLKNGQGKRFKALKPHLNSFKRRWILTGTPAPNGYIDLWGQMYVADGGLALGRYITHFRRQYFDQGGYGGYEYTIRPGAAAQIEEAVKPYVLTLQAEDYITMPELIRAVVKVELPLDARQLYNQVEQTFLAELGGNTILAQNAAAAGTKCRQIANGAVYDEDHETHFVHDAKMEVLEDYIEELSGQPCLVFYEYVHDMERIMKKFPKAKRIGSGVGDKAMAEAIDEFNAGTLPMLVAHPASAGHGLNLQGAAAHVCWFGLTWDLELYDQAISRVHRQGNPNKHVFVHHIIAADTLDVKVLRVLAGKDRTQKALMKALLS